MLTLPVRCVYLSLICTCTWTTFVISQEESSWIVLQHEGLDELFIQTRQFDEARELRSARIRDVCDSILNAATHPSFRINNFRSSIRGEIADVELGNLSYENGYRIHSLGGTRVLLYPCSETLFLSPAYEDGHLFFLFVYDLLNTREMALEALVQEQAVPLGRQSDEYDADEIEISYVGQRATFYEYLYNAPKDTDLPENDFFGDPVCRGSVEQKVRLCASVLSIPDYKSQYIFSPSVVNVDKECRERYLDLKNFGTRITQSMYRCRVMDINNPREWTAIYLSRSYRNYEVYTYTVVDKVEGVELVKLEKDVGKLFLITEPEYNEGMDALLLREVAHYRTALASELQSQIEQ